ncbi:MAG: hypothetical protein F6K54_28950 [Okeania sp. SIO3B5]|uniref:hypothetical protein n=1 Tax=Okeania sp. SIO3B5 TaxID=2607811 RepID=UPI0013FF191E|nr:hypothetical protein [Okeania sp. SIO3B5]NEO56752.1 hypothetical protein [Okeania sp. SIO3B5]
MEDQLQNLITQIKQYQNPSPARQKAINRLLILIQQLPGLYSSSHQDYLEAFNRTLEWVCKNIQNFEPRPPSWERSFVVWINGYLKWRIQDLYTPDNRYESLDKPISDEGEKLTTLGEILPANSLSLLEQKIAELQKAKRQIQGESLRQYIEKDPEEKLRLSHPKKYPECNCQVLAIQLNFTVPPKKISDICKEINISKQTVYSHWKRRCIPLLREIANQFGEEL